MTDFALTAVFVSLLALLHVRAYHILAQDRLHLQARLRDEELAREEAQDMRAHQRQRETHREMLEGLREVNREFFRLSRELEEGDEPWKR